ncbi:hypothetical protein PLESTB_000757400 [Pleodorina starrii]|uniref:rRNA biogenesis protein RRP36 n=1 Tax=Pleodorina starrii TaxID=330485 RepID=A0A9W6BKL0_9CHLO|nr:hypothetical protein PLESTM_001573400 [Pleodorina starrii]GLC53510.1 hypothetical protein PLESTB_000757400 [Pleodorina starrii]GLC65792.1 hypothetical protein PLESTF_000340500 [Pleodorina starrii]
MPPLAKKNQSQVRKRPVPVEESDNPSSDDAPEELTKDQQRALKRFKAGMDDDDSDGAGSDGEVDDGDDDDDDDGGVARVADDDESDEGESGDDDGEDSEYSDDDDDERTLEEQVADVPFETLEALRQDGRGLVGPAARAAAARAAASSFKRDNKDRPQEISSKRPVGRFREVIQVPHRENRDPRFDSTSGPPATDTFRRRYSFLYNDTLPKEKAELQAKIKKEKNPKFKARLQSELQRVDTALRDEDLRRRTQKLESEWKSKERNAVASGKNPFFLKAADKKRLALLAKYQELKERGKLDKFMEKRRKKNAAKDHRYLPSGRRQQQED